MEGGREGDGRYVGEGRELGWDYRIKYARERMKEGRRKEDGICVVGVR